MIPEGWDGVATVLGLGVMTLVTRVFFLVPSKPVRLPPWLQQGLKVAPLAALAAVVAPELLLRDGALVSAWRDARWPAALLASLYYVWRPGVLGPMLAGLAAYLPLRLAWGW